MIDINIVGYVEASFNFEDIYWKAYTAVIDGFFIGADADDYYCAGMQEGDKIYSINIDGTVWTDGDIISYAKGKDRVYGIFSLKSILEECWNGTGNTNLSNFNKQNKNAGSFFDDKEKWSKELWDLPKEEGIKKFCEILKIK